MFLPEEDRMKAFRLKEEFNSILGVTTIADSDELFAGVLKGMIALAKRIKALEAKELWRPEKR